MNTFSQVPPGFRFHPTDEELVDYYLRNKINSRSIELDVLKDIDLYKIEPWDLQELCRLGTEDQNEWYFFSHKDKKYPTGTRTNRATTAGFWKATGRDKAIYLKHELIGMRKTLVFYKGRAPNGQKSDWIMHEYRLESDENGSPQEEGWAVCRVFKKKLTTVQRMNEHESSSSCWFDDQVSFMPNLIESPKENNIVSYDNRLSWYPCKKETDRYHHNCPRIMQYYTQIPHNNNQFLPIIPRLEAPNKQFLHQTKPPTPTHTTRNNNMMLVQFDEQYTGSHDHNLHHEAGIQNNNVNDSQITSSAIVGQGSMTTDWRMLDKLVASQLISHEDRLISDENYPNAENDMFGISGGDGNDHQKEDTRVISDSMQQDLEYQQPESTTSASNLSTCPIDLWEVVTNHISN
ncbi:unnamed protein product [Rhodiola kirilowii]